LVQTVGASKILKHSLVGVRYDHGHLEKGP